MTRHPRGDRGSAVTEFLVIGLLVLVPIAYVVLSVMRVQAAAFASTQAAREAGRAFVTADSAAVGMQRAAAAARLAFADQGFELPARALELRCRPAACLTPGSVVDVSIDWAVDLPWMPRPLESMSSVPVHVVHEVPVDVFRVNT